MKKILTFALFSLLWCNVSYSSISVELYLKAMSGDDKRIKSTIERNLMGINDGLMYANGELRSLKKEQLYCQPSKLALTSSMIVSFLDAEIESFKDKGIDISKVPIGMILLESFKKVFPC
jgi:hypothetical protein